MIFVKYLNTLREKNMNKAITLKKFLKKEGERRRRINRPKK
jgi:hypothetical protein